jgi:hypothetical protein
MTPNSYSGNLLQKIANLGFKSSFGAQIFDVRVIFITFSEYCGTNFMDFYMAYVFYTEFLTQIHIVYCKQQPFFT